MLKKKDLHQQRAGGSGSGCIGVLEGPALGLAHWAQAGVLFCWGFGETTETRRRRHVEERAKRLWDCSYLFIVPKAMGARRQSSGGQGGRGGGKGELSFDLGPRKVSGTSRYSAET